MCVCVALPFGVGKTTCGLLSIMDSNPKTNDSNVDIEDFIFIEKQPFTEPIWGKVVNK